MFEMKKKVCSGFLSSVPPSGGWTFIKYTIIIKKDIYKIFVRTEFDVFGKYSTGDEIEVAKPTPVIQNFNNHLSEYTNGSSLDYVYL